MLGGIDPIIIIHRFKKVEVPIDTASTIPISSKNDTFISLVPIPIYLSETLTNLLIASENKTVAVETETQTLSDGTQSTVNQKGITSSVSINIEAHKDSIPIILLSAFIDSIFDKVTSKEYAISYIHGAITIFQGVLHNFTLDQVSGTELLQVKIELSKGNPQPTKKAIVAPVKSSTGILPILPVPGAA